ncbi:hypothetical protein ACI2KS_23930 [Pseudomonas sp. NPDC087358]|uniref:hypothetical protein n=1 Tax=Pseudomonas sp. NPDC087358 TaxID=3364439 RepID=UPI00384DB92F
MNSGLTLFLLVALAGLCLFVAGVYVLVGTGWALIGGAVCLITTAGFIRKGLTSE